MPRMTTADAAIAILRREGVRMRVRAARRGHQPVLRRDAP